MLFGFGRKKKQQPAQDTQATEERRKGFFSRLRQGLGKTSKGLTEGLGQLLLGKKSIDDEILEDLETRLLTADVGIEATGDILDGITARLKRNELKDAAALVSALQEEMEHLLEPVAIPLEIDNSSHQPYVILMVGINGAGKTTTTGKLARLFQQQGASVMLAAGDTFRAAAVEQLKVWGERNDIPVVAQSTGADSASVIFDAMQSSQARGTDILIADTAGRLHTQTNLMEELKKVVRVMKKVDMDAPHEVLLVLDASIGQNALQQARYFHEAIGVTGLVLTKLDGTAKGGVICALAKSLGIPVRFIGVGEGIDDLRPFDHREFVQAILDIPEEDRVDQ
ncbi:MAG: signal recognition particle-docking protein FtsY [Gammaproteobacteria bacterium]|nr:MAG: signal recognition particle-docking protein FtsY [Gammaproteobacteria bacterium]